MGPVEWVWWDKEPHSGTRGAGFLAWNRLSEVRSAAAFAVERKPPDGRWPARFSQPEWEGRAGAGRRLGRARPAARGQVAPASGGRVEPLGPAPR